MTCNFSQSWIHNFQNFSGAACPQTPLETPKNSPCYARNIVGGGGEGGGGGQISRSFLKLKLDRSVWRVRQIYHSFLKLKLDRSGNMNEMWKGGYQ